MPFPECLRSSLALDGNGLKARWGGRQRKARAKARSQLGRAKPRQNSPQGEGANPDDKAPGPRTFRNALNKENARACRAGVRLHLDAHEGHQARSEKRGSRSFQIIFYLGVETRS